MGWIGKIIIIPFERVVHKLDLCYSRCEMTSGSSEVVANMLLRLQNIQTDKLASLLISKPLAYSDFGQLIGKRRRETFKPVARRSIFPRAGQKPRPIHGVSVFINILLTNVSKCVIRWWQPIALCGRWHSSPAKQMINSIVNDAKSCFNDGINSSYTHHHPRALASRKDYKLNSPTAKKLQPNLLPTGIAP